MRIPASRSPWTALYDIVSLLVLPKPFLDNPIVPWHSQRKFWQILCAHPASSSRQLPVSAMIFQYIYPLSRHSIFMLGVVFINSKEDRHLTSKCLLYGSINRYRPFFDMSR